MSNLCNMILSFCLCVLTFYASVDSIPVAENDIKDNGYLGLATKTIPKSVISINLRLIKNLQKEKPGENVLFSALGAYSALMMLHLGAGNKTREELDRVFRIKDNDVDHDKLHETFSMILDKIKSKGAGNAEYPAPETAIANGFFIQKGRSIHESYTQLLKKYYDANATNVDFQGHATEATNFINEWISNCTNKRIEKFYSDSLPATTVSVLTNAWYFNGIWKDTFEKDQTKTEKFNTESSEIDVQMMRNQKVVPYSRSESLMFETIEIPYSGGEFVAAISMPFGNQTLKNLTEHVQQFDAREFNQNVKIVGIDYKIPKLKISGKNSLVDALGLVDIFQHADLSRMSDEKIPVSDVFQAADLDVNEQGTIATAATAISSTRVLSPPVLAEKQFYVNRPYMITLLHKPTSTILMHCNVYKPHY